jgi:hypothetical protein
MASECGSTKMPSSHGCCHKSNQAGNLDLSQPSCNSNSLQTAPALNAELPQLSADAARTASHWAVDQPQHSPPLGAHIAISVLRI